MLSGVFLMPSCSPDKNGGTDTTDAQGNNGYPPDSEEGTSTTTDGDNVDLPEGVEAVIYDMLTEALVRPVGIDNEQPVFSWKVKSDVMGWAQSAYRIIVKNGDIISWDSGKVLSADSVGIKYDGDPLLSSTEYVWELSVWDNDGKNEYSSSSAFETGLLGNSAFDDAKWISYASKELYSGTKYTIDFDFIIHRDNQGFCFSMQDSGTFIMWQVNTYDSAGKVFLRPHFKSGGNWTAYPGGPGNVSAVDITDAVGYSGNITGKIIHERIEVDGRVVKTYFGKDEDSLTLASTYTHSQVIPLINIGFRHSSEANTACEVASYDNIVIKDGDGNLIYENDFSDSSDLSFSGSSSVSLENGMIKVGSESTMGESILVRNEDGGLPAFRKTFAVREGLVSAKLYTSGLGVYESFVNGQRVGRVLDDGTVVYHELKPGFTEASDRKFYNTYEIVSFLSEGSDNTLSAVVSSGWWSDAAAAGYGKDDAYLAKLILTYDDGTKETIVTDGTWKSARASAVIYADIFTGESYDARVDESWMLPEFDDSDWENAKINNEFKGEICAWIGSYITVRDELGLDAKSVVIYDGVNGSSSTAYGTVNVVRTYGDEKFTLSPGETALIDFGQNFAGWESFSVEGKAGTRLTIIHGEMLNDENGAHSRGNDGPEGSIYNANYRSAAATTTYIVSGDGIEEYHPSFTFYGFRYIEITADAEVTIHSVDGQVVTSVEKDTGFLETSDDDVNQLISNIRWGQYSNYLSVPTDCPQRDERQGWTADTQVFSKAGSYMAFSKSFLEKFMADMRDSQNAQGAYPGTAPTGEYAGAGWGGTGWADAGIIVPYNLYVMYGDTSVILENWESMQKYVDGFLARTGKKGPSSIWGDWLAYESNDAEIQAMLAVCFYAWDALMMSEMAEAIGHYDEAERYTALYETEKEYFQSMYVRSDGRLKRQEQTACLYALYLDLLPDEQSVEAVKEQLVNNISRNRNRLQTGFLGTAIILPTLTKIGRSDIAYTLLLQHSNPSWLYSVDQGATTIWERWNSYTIESGFGDVSMNSFNHYAYGAVASWMFESLAGIGADPDNPGFKHILFAPQPDDRLSVKASYDSAYGVITAESSYDGDIWTYKCSLPANTTAEIRIPVSDAGDVVVNGKAASELSLSCDGIEFAGIESGVAVFNAVSYSFTFSVNMAG